MRVEVLLATLVLVWLILCDINPIDIILIFVAAFLAIGFIRGVFFGR